MTMGWPSEQTSSVSSVVRSRRVSVAALLVHERDERIVELAQQRHPLALAAGDLVELLLHACREGDVDVVAEVLDEHVGDDAGHDLGPQAAILDLDVAALDDRRDRGGVRGGPADAVLLEGLDERRLREARRRLGEVLVALDVLDPGPLALGEVRQARLGLVLGTVVATLGVDPREAVERRAGGAGAQPEAAGLELGGGRLHAPWRPSARRGRAAR